MLAFDTDRAKRNMRLGYFDGLKAYRRLEGNAYTFHPGETRRNAKNLAPAIDRVRHHTGVSLFRNRERLPRVQNMLARHGGATRFLPQRACPCSFGCAVTTAAEITGELLGVPADKTYTMLAFNRLLREAARQTSKRTLLYLCEALRTAYYRGEAPRSFWRAATLFPAEFVAANYLVILENR
jgi:hypothetical protein